MIWSSNVICGARLRSTYLRTHQRRHCHGRPAEAEDDQVDQEGGPGGEEAAEGVEDGEDGEDDLFHIDEVLAIANELDQTVMGGGIGARDEEEEEEALALQRHLHQQRLNSEKNGFARFNIQHCVKEIFCRKTLISFDPWLV